jgi:Icc-related predicted phosphoesterase
MTSPSGNSLRFVIVSDTHCRHNAVTIPDGDVLLHCGDFTMYGSPAQIADFDEWLESLPHRYKVVIAGNHDKGFEDAPEAARHLLKTPIYLQDSSIRIEGVNIYGSPWQPWFYDWSFNFPKGPKGRFRARETWAKIPDDVDVLVTHGPPASILDIAPIGGSVGCPELLEAVRRVKPALHAFGHIHEGYGTLQRDTLFVNASTCDERYVPSNAPIIVDLADGIATVVPGVSS